MADLTKMRDTPQKWQAGSVTAGQAGQSGRAGQDRPATPADQAGRAETYLRLRAEAELRHALTFPPYESPGPVAFAGFSGPGRLARWRAWPPASFLARAVRPLASVRYRTRLGYERLRWPLLRLSSRAISAARALPWIRSPSRALAQDETSAEQGAERLRTLADLLVRAGVIDDQTADSVVAGHETALLARSRLDPGLLEHWEVFGRHGRLQAPVPAGLFRAVPVQATVPAAPDGSWGETTLLALVIAPDSAVLTAAGRPPRQRGGAPYLEDPRLAFGSIRRLGRSADPADPVVVDDRGNRYQLELGSWSGEPDEDWSGTLEISPIPAAGIRWLDLTMRPDAPTIRIELADPGGGSQAATAPRATETPVTGALKATAAALPAGTAVDQILDEASRGLLHRAVMSQGGLPDRGDISDVTDIVTALEASGALPPSSPGLARLVAVARQVGISVPAALSPFRAADSLPAAWTSVLANRDRRDGPVGNTAAAIVLPELEGTRVVLAGLRSSAAEAELHVLAWGWPDEERYMVAHQEEPLSWWARDDAGRWHLAEMNGGGFGDGQADFELRLIPPLHPEASALEVCLTGRSGHVTVTVPLDWQEPAFDSQGPI